MNMLVKKTVVYTDGSVKHGDRSGYGFSARIKGNVIAESVSPDALI